MSEPDPASGCLQFIATVFILAAVLITYGYVAALDRRITKLEQINAGQQEPTGAKQTSKIPVTE